MKAGISLPTPGARVPHEPREGNDVGSSVGHGEAAGGVAAAIHAGVVRRPERVDHDAAAGDARMPAGPPGGDGNDASAQEPSFAKQLARTVAAGQTAPSRAEAAPGREGAVQLDQVVAAPFAGSDDDVAEANLEEPPAAEREGHVADAEVLRGAALAASRGGDDAPAPATEPGRSPAVDMDLPHREEATPSKMDTAEPGVSGSEGGRDHGFRAVQTPRPEHEGAADSPLTSAGRACPTFIRRSRRRPSSRGRNGSKSRQRFLSMSTRARWRPPRRATHLRRPGGPPRCDRRRWRER